MSQSNTYEVSVKGRSYSVSLSDTALVSDVKQHIASLAHLDVNRQGVKFPVASTADKVIRLDDASQTLGFYRQAYSQANDSEAPFVLQVSDRGPQFSYRGVFIIEYAGPIAIMLLFAMRPKLFYPSASGSLWNSDKGSATIRLAVCLWLAHFVKRELETLFVHRFSRPTMPLMNLFKNSAYYWLFAVGVGLFLCSPDFAPMPTNSPAVIIGTAIMVVSELVNLAVHVQLRMMRPREGSTARQAPTGPLFSLVSCPNYTAEVMGWVGFSILTGLIVSWVFTCVGLAQMTQWALQKHRGYIKSDPTYRRRGRKAIIPFIL